MWTFSCQDNRRLLGVNATMNDTPIITVPTQTHFIGAGVVILKRGKAGIEVLLIRRGKPPRMGEWSIPGGRQEIGETVRETAIREIKEETELTVTDIELLDVVDTFQKDSAGRVIAQWTLVDFRAWWSDGTPRAGSDAAEVRWVPIEELGRYNLWDETNRIITQAAQMPL